MFILLDVQDEDSESNKSTQALINVTEIVSIEEEENSTFTTVFLKDKSTYRSPTALPKIVSVIKDLTHVGEVVRQYA